MLDMRAFACISESAVVELAMEVLSKTSLEGIQIRSIQDVTSSFFVRLLEHVCREPLSSKCLAQFNTQCKTQYNTIHNTKCDAQYSTKYNAQYIAMLIAKYNRLEFVLPTLSVPTRLAR